MAKYKYNVTKMKNCASGMERELTDFRKCRNNINSIISKLSANWDDTNNRDFVNKYNRDIKPIAEDLEKFIQSYIEIMRESARRYGSAIDNGNSKFSQ